MIIERLGDDDGYHVINKLHNEYQKESYKFYFLYKNIYYISTKKMGQKFNQHTKKTGKVL